MSPRYVPTFRGRGVPPPTTDDAEREQRIATAQERMDHDRRLMDAWSRRWAPGGRSSPEVTDTEIFAEIPAHTLAVVAFQSLTRTLARQEDAEVAELLRQRAEDVAALGVTIEDLILLMVPRATGLPAERIAAILPPPWEVHVLTGDPFIEALAAHARARRRNFGAEAAYGAALSGIEAENEDAYQQEYNRLEALAIAAGDELSRATAALQELVWRTYRPDTPSAPTLGRRQLPGALRHPTYPEAASFAVALSDGPSLRRWLPDSQAIAWHHQIDGEALTIRFSGDLLSKWWSIPSTSSDMETLLRRAGIDASFLSYNCLGLLVESEGIADVTIDNLIALVGWKPRSSAQRQEQRRMVWEWVNVMACFEVNGRRRGTFVDPTTKVEHDMTTRDPLLLVRVPDVDGQQLSLDPSEPPPAVSLYAIGFLRQYLGNRSVLQDIGNVRALSQIPTRQPSGQWARALGMTLHRRWRMRAVWPDAKPGRFDFSRRELLEEYTPKPDPTELLASSDPKRAREYWRGALELLRTKPPRIVTRWSEPPEATLPRQGWDAIWLDQTVTVEPSAEIRADLDEVRRSRAAHLEAARPKAATRRRRRKPSPAAT